MRGREREARRRGKRSGRRAGRAWPLRSKTGCSVIPQPDLCTFFLCRPAWCEPLSTEGARGALQGHGVRKLLFFQVLVCLFSGAGRRLWSTQTFSAPSRLCDALAQPTPFEKFLHHPQCCVPVPASYSPKRSKSY